MNIGMHSDGRSLSYDEATGQFAIGDHLMTADQVRTALQSGQLSWHSSHISSWFDSSFPRVSDAAIPDRSSKPSRRRAGLITALVLGVLILAVGGVAAALMVMRAEPAGNLETKASKSRSERAGNREMQASIPSLEFIDPSSLVDPNVTAGTVLSAGSYDVFLTGEHIRTVQWLDDDNGNVVSISLTFDEQGAQQLATFTAEHLQQPLPIAVEGAVIFTPIVLEPIVGGEVTITGAEDLREILEPRIVPTR